MKIGILLTEFPNQTSVAMWRVGVAMRDLGESVQLLSTRCSGQAKDYAKTFGDDLSSVFHAWPPSSLSACLQFLRHPTGLLQSLRYLCSLSDQPLRGKVKLLGLLVSGASLARYCRREGIDHVVVHSMANAAHLIAFAKYFAGSSFSLRLGGDLEVYGGDHDRKTEQASLIIAAAENNRKQVIRELGLSPDRVIQSSLGVDCSQFRPPSLPRVAPSLSDPVRLVTVARLNRCKGHTDVFAAMERLQDSGIAISYRVVGEGPQRQELEAEVARRRLTGHVKFVGAANQEVVISELQRAQVFVLPSVGKGEASPVALLEAMACGLVSIATRIGGTPQMIDDGTDGYLVDQHSPEQIAERIEGIANHAMNFESVSRQARERALESDCHQVARKILSAIRIQEAKEAT
ncbi:MAG: glycosyltransferase [Planctomycetota bacterium]